MFKTKLIVNGDYLDARSGAVYQRECAIGEGIATVSAAADAADACAAANAAASAFPAWSTMPNEQRSEILQRAGNILLEKTGVFVEAMAKETGATEEWARFNCETAAGMFRHAAKMVQFERRIQRQGFDHRVTSYLLRQPAGVVLGIVPWNAPVVLATRAIAIPLAVGNTVVLKASERCPRTHSLVIETMIEAGTPDGVVNLVCNAPETAPVIVDALIGHAAVRRVNFTGSNRVGQKIAETCARYLKPVVLELSGKATLLVLDDAEIERAANAAAHGAYFNQGQVCLSTERVVVDNSRADEFVQRLAEVTANIRVGNPRKKGVQFGPLISANAAIRVRNLIEDAVDKGARLVVGGEVSKSTMEPALLDHVDSSMRIYHEESFGPVASVIRVSSEDEAITIANDTEYGLASAVHSQDVERALRIAEQLDCGVCQINGSTVYDDANMPFGGMKASGFGKMAGAESINEFTDLRWVAVHDDVGKFTL